MLILAMAPPESLSFKLFVALLMLGLVGIFLRARRGSSFSGRSVWLSIAVATSVVLMLEALLPGSYGDGLHDRGLLAAIVGAISAASLLRAAEQGGQKGPSSSKNLAVIALITGPLTGLALATLTVLLTDVPPMDRGHTVWVFTVIGGGIVAMAQALSKLDSSGSDRQA